MKTSKTLSIVIEISAEEIKELIMNHLLSNDEELKKIHDKDSKPTVSFWAVKEGQINDFGGCKISLSKTK